VLIREYNESDLDALRAIHASQGFEYSLPDLSNPLFVTKLVLSDRGVVTGFSPPSSLAEAATKDAALPRWAPGGAVQETILAAPENPNARGEGNCRILGAAFLRLTAEAYLLLDPRAGTPRERWQWLLTLHEAARRDAWQRGLEDAHAWLPPPIAQKFGRRLERLGWRRDDSWTPYCTRLGAE
jgi:hypothetical protein